MITIVRHGQTRYNLEKITQGQADTPLNETGLKQAEEVAEKLKDMKFDIIYCSPLQRARQTAEAINKYHNLEIKFDDRLMERDAGRRTHHPYNELTDEEKKLWHTTPELWGAEKKIDFYNRCLSFYKEIEGSKQSILLVSHGGFYVNIKRYQTNNLDFTQYVPELDNCGYEILED